MAQIYGYKPDPTMRSEPDGTLTDLRLRDKKFADLAKNIATEAGDVDLSRYCVAMNQYALSACVGNGTCEALEILENIAHEGIAGYTPTLLARLFVYNMARIEESSLDQDAGTHIRTAFDVLSRFGVCSEILWPYVEDQVFTSPSILSQRQALGHKIHAYYRLDSTGTDRLNDIVTALQAKHTPVFGTQVTLDFERLVSDKPVDRPDENVTIAGGHCMVIVGYINGKFLVKNSWGTGWGADGFCFMTPEYIAWEQTSDIWVPTLSSWA